MIHDEELEKSPYHYPAQCIAMHLDRLLIDTLPVRKSDIFESVHRDITDYLTRAVWAYSDMVLDSDPNPDKSNAAKVDYRRNHHITEMVLPLDEWDYRTIAQGPIVLNIVNGPFYAVALMTEGPDLVIKSLTDNTKVIVTTS